MKLMMVLQALAVAALAQAQGAKSVQAPVPSTSAGPEVKPAFTTKPFPENPGVPAPKGGRSQVPIPPATSTAPAPEDKILAKIGSEVIRESDFQSYLSHRFAPQQVAKLSSMPEVKERLRNEFLDSEVIVAKARKEGLDKTDEYKKSLAVLEMQALFKAYMHKEEGALMKERQVSDAEIEAFYEGNKTSFKAPDTFSARHILVKVKGGANGNQGLSEEEARAKVLKAKEELAKGRTWEEVAKEFSEDPGSKDKGGLYENKRFGEFVKEFDEAVRTQAPGKPGDPVKTPFGYHLIQVEKWNKGEIPSLDKIKEQVRQRAVAKKSEQVWRSLIEGLKKDIGFLGGEAAAQAVAATPAHQGSKKPSKKASAKAPAGKK